MQELSKPEQPETATFKNKKLFFEQNIADQQTKKPPIESYRSSHSSINDYQPCNVSAENQWMTAPNHYSHHSPALWEQELNKAISQNTKASAAPYTSPHSHQCQETIVIRHPKVPPKPPGRVSYLPKHVETAASTQGHAKTQSDERARLEQDLQKTLNELLNELNEHLGQLDANQENNSV